MSELRQGNEGNNGKKMDAAAVSSTSSILDSALSILRSETLSIVLGSTLLLALVCNRLFTEDLYDSQSRTDLIAVLSAGGLLLNGISLQDITSKEADIVEISGEKYTHILDMELIAEKTRTYLVWFLDSIQSIFPNVASILVYYDGKTIVKHGLLPALPSSISLKDDQSAKLNNKQSNVDVKLILKKALNKELDSTGLSLETYIPDLQVLPGKIEFTYLPENTQAVVIQPFKNQKGMLIFGLDKKRAFSPRDIFITKILTMKLQSILSNL